MSTSSNLPVFTAVIKLSAFAISLNITATEELYRSWHSCKKKSVCCIGISSNDIDLEVVVYLLKYCFDKLSDTIRCLHCLFVMEMTYSTP